MAVTVCESADGIEVRLTGLDRVLCWRRGVHADRNQIVARRAEIREVLESTIDHRALGWGSHVGGRRPGRRRVGVMLGRGVTGDQFWALPAGPVDDTLAVLDLTDHRFARLVLPHAPDTGEHRAGGGRCASPPDRPESSP